MANLTTRDKYWIYQTLCQANSLKFAIKLYRDHKNLWLKHALHQKTESYKSCFSSKLDNIVNSNSIFNTNIKCSGLHISTAIPTICTKSIFLSSTIQPIHLKGPVNMQVLRGMILFQSLSSSSKYGQGKQSSRSLIPYR